MIILNTRPSKQCSQTFHDKNVGDLSTIKTIQYGIENIFYYYDAVIGYMIDQCRILIL